MLLLADLRSQHASRGLIAWIGLRPARLAGMVSVRCCNLGPDGLSGDHARPGKRAVTLIQAEHLPVIASLAGLDTVSPEMLRRNFLVSGINLSALRGATVRVGGAEILIGGPCAPCSRMETALGQGGYNAMRGHGGWCASVVVPGCVTLGDEVFPAG